VRDPIPYALETDWPVEAAGFEPLHLRSEFTKTLSLADRLELAHLGWQVREPPFSKSFWRPTDGQIPEVQQI
jgi:hypothetical protein